MKIQKSPHSFRHSAIGLCSVLALSCGLAWEVRADNKVQLYEIKQQDLASALQNFAITTDLEVLYKPDLVKGKEVKSQLKGIYTPNEALEILLNSSGLTYEFTSSKTLLIKAGEEEADNPSPAEETKNEEAAAAKDSGKEVAEEIIVTGSRLITDPGKMTRQITVFDREEIERSGATRLDEFLRRLPQNVNAPSNIGSGFPDNERFFDFGLGTNVFSGSSVNLRGLGAQYTLILINGRRPPKGGQFGGITDISNIPVERVERIEVLFDGAAAIYGADAIGGVVNIITNREYEGTDVSLTYADTADGGGKRYNLNLGHTLNWDTGSLTATFSYQTQDAIDGSQRDIPLGQADQFVVPPSAPGNISGALNASGQTIPLMWVRDVDGNGDTLNESLNERLTGTVDIRVSRLGVIGVGPNGPIFGQVESTVRVDRGNPVINPTYTLIDPLPANPADDGYRPVMFAQVPEYNGQPLGLYDVSDSGELGEDLSLPFQGHALTPEDETFSVGLALDQQLTDNLQLGLSLDYSKTDKVSNTNGAADETTIDSTSLSNPFGDDIRYAWVNEFPQQARVVDSTSVSLSGDLDWDLNDNWSVKFGFGIGETKKNSDSINRLRNYVIGPPSEDPPASLRDLLNGYTTVFIDGSGFERVELGSHFYDPFLGFDSAQALVDATFIPFQHTHNYSASRDLDITVRGNLFELPAGDLVSSLTIAHKRETFEIFDSNQLFVTDVFEDGNNEGSVDLDYDEQYGTSTNRVAGEIAIPLVDDNMALPLVDSLLLTTSGSYEKYSNVEDKGFNWAAGFNWGVNDWLKIRFNRTYNLRVPEPVRSARDPKYSRRPFYSIYTDPNDFFGDRGVRIFEPLWRIEGGADHLKSERNYSTSLGFIFRPTFSEGLDLQFNLTESHTLDQIRAGMMNSRFTANDLLPENVAANPLLAYADPENNPDHDLVFVNGNGDIIPILPGELILDDRAHNVGNTFNRGADLEVRYDFRSDWGDWLVVWRHQYTHVNEVVQSDVCANGVCNDETRGRASIRSAEPVDTVGTVSRTSFTYYAPIPRNKGSFELNWGYRGLGVNLSTQYQQETSIIQGVRRENFLLPLDHPAQRVNIYREDTRPAQSVNMAVSYDFGDGDLFDAPQWLASTEVSLTVDDVWRKERSVNIVYLRQEFDAERQPLEVNRYGLNARGRAFSLRIRSTF